MITKIPEGQICQAFDPMMFLPEKTLNIIVVTENANTSCVAPAFVYVDGSHGKKFLCDFHYYYEIHMTKDGGYKVRADAWEDIQQYKIDEREKIKETFAKNVTTTKTLGHKCSIFSTHRPELRCLGEAFVYVTPKIVLDDKINFTDVGDLDKEHGILYCNFHFRKNYYRYYSNGVAYEDFHNILDERCRMTVTIAEEAKNLTLV